ncbi:uncharacterized protein VICG_00269, partial [Vittaforma corneae ATCC 50505]
MASLTKKQQKQNPRKRHDKDALPNGQPRKNSKKAERGPTKKEMREELKKSAADKRSKRKLLKTSSGEHSNSKNSDSRKDNGPKIKDSKAGNGKVKSQKSMSAKVLYSEENINSFLLEAKGSKSKDKAVNMLLFVFKHFKNRPAEILSKIKILTSDKKTVYEGSSLHDSVLKHLFCYFGMEGSVAECIFSMLSTGSLLSRYVCDFLFSTTFDNDEYNFYFESICSELCKTVEKVSTFKMGDYLDLIGEMDSVDDIQTCIPDIAEESLQQSSSVENGSHCIDQGESGQASVPNGEDCASDHSESSISLVSLNDDAEIERLDRQIGKMLSRGMLSSQDETYATNLTKCLELLVQHNYAVKTENLVKILYFGQFECIAKAVKFVVKDLLQKICEPERVFKIYQMCSLAIPDNYRLFSTFFTYCGDSFDLKAFMIPVLNAGHEEYLVSRIDKDKFYSIYDSTLGQPFDDFLISLVQTEHRRERLRELEDQYFKPEIKNAISGTLKRLSTSKAGSKKDNEN